ncbi:MAG: T9SS type A sorting domain-containing protein [Bacteroidales bacterium]|jgi:hypothetical protein|nr:T9SS type A sorting domain-containing protein [Bacteroidales bacterium]
MKRLAFLVAMTAGICSLQAQTAFPDGGFESNWQLFPCETRPGGSSYWDFPTGSFITTLNVLYDMDASTGIADLTAFREETDIYSGNYALKLESHPMTLGGNTIFLPGVAATFTIDIGDVSCVLGRPFTSNPVALKGFKKALPVNGDSAAIEIWVQKAGVVLGGGKKVYTSVDADYEEFNIPLIYLEPINTTPDTIVVIFTASGNYDFTDINTLQDCQGQENSTLYVDEVSFEYSNGVVEFLDPEVKVNFYPNPAKDQINISVDNNLTAKVMIYDYLARPIGETTLSNGKANLNVTSYPSGSYIINVLDNGKVITSGRFVKE